VFTFLLAVLNQEITILEFPVFTLCYVLFGKRRAWPDEVRVAVIAVCALAFVALDLGWFALKCTTALEGVTARIEASFGWSFEKPTNLLALLVGYSRLHLALSAFLLPGFVIAVRRNHTVWTFLYFYLALSVVVVNVLITGKGFRYQYHLISIWIILCLYGMQACANWLLPQRADVLSRAVLAGGWILVVVLSWSPWRIPPSYNESLQGDPVRALRFVSDNLRSGDRIAISECFPQAALLETGRCDYDLNIPIYYDFVYRKGSYLLDRNAGARTIGHVDELRRLFAQNERLWVAFCRQQIMLRDRDIQWKYPGARAESYLRENAQLVYRSYLWDVFLWDRRAGQYSPFREKPGNWFD
jgi:hypothetical protein